MFHGSPSLTVAQGRDYYDREYSPGDHSTGGPTGCVRQDWFGRGAQSLGLSGPVRKEAFAALLEGRAGEGGPFLVQGHNGTGKHLAGWDFTCSADKSVSLMSLVGGDSGVLEAHRKAVDAGLAELERFVQVLQKHRRVTTGSLVGARFEHQSSRRLDPHLHTHCVVMNMSRRSDGAWRALAVDELFAAVTLATAIYRAEMARELGGLGYAVVVRPPCAVGIDGFSKEQLAHFSQRSQDIERYLQKRGWSGPRAAAQAALRTRAAKIRGIDPTDLLACWRQRAESVGLDLKAMREMRGERRVPSPDVARAAARESVAFAVAQVSETQAVFQERELEVAALQHGMGRIVIEEVRAVVPELGGLIRRKDPRLPTDLLTTREALGWEVRTIALMRAGQNRGLNSRPSLPPPRPLSVDQERVVRFVLGCRDEVVGIRARAGPARRDALAALRASAEAGGWTVRGMTPEGGAPGVDVDVVSQAGLSRGGATGPRRPELWIVDETEHLGGKAAALLLERATQAGAKVVLVGAPGRAPGAAGYPFAYLRMAGLRFQGLRQAQPERSPALREALACASAGKLREALDVLEGREQVVEVAGLRDRHLALVKAVLRAPGTLVVVPGEDERQELNRQIREELIATGTLERGAVLLPVLVRRGISIRGSASRYVVGDRIKFLRRSQACGVERGGEGRVLGLDLRKRRVTIETTDGRVWDCDPRRLPAHEIVAVEELPVAVGDRVQLCEAIRELRVSRGPLGTITRLEENRARIVFDGGRRVWLPLGKGPLPLAHAYAVTAASAQGMGAVERILLSVDSARGRDLVSGEQFFFLMARSQKDLLIFTDSRKALPATLGLTATVGWMGKRERSDLGVERGSESGPRRHTGRDEADPGRGERRGAGRGWGEPGDPIPPPRREGEMADHRVDRPGGAARGAGGPGREAGRSSRSHRGATERTLRTLERVPSTPHGDGGACGSDGPDPGGDRSRPAAGPIVAGGRSLETGRGSSPDPTHADRDRPPVAPGCGPGARLLEGVGGREPMAALRSGASGPRSRAEGDKKGWEHLPPLTEVLARIRAFESEEEDRTMEAQAERDLGRD